MTVSASPAARSIEPATVEWWILLIWGVCSVIVGGWLLVTPIASAIVLLSILALVWLIGGIVEITGAVLRRGPAWGWRFAGGVFNVLVALFVLGHPLLGTLTAVSALYLLIAISAAYNGVTGLVGNHDRSTSRIALGLLQLVLACAMLVGYVDVVNLRLFVQAIGLLAIGGGIVVAVSSFHVKHPATAHA